MKKILWKFLTIWNLMHRPFVFSPLGNDLPKITLPIVYREISIVCIAGHAGSMINVDQCRVKFVELTPMSINKH